MPTGSDIAVIMPADSEKVSSRDIVVYKKAACHPSEKSLMQVDVNHPMYDLLMYVFKFPYGTKDLNLISLHQIGRVASAVQCNTTDVDL